MRLNLTQFPGSNHAQTGKAVGFSAPAQLLQTRQFFRVSRNNHFPADFMGNSMFAASTTDCSTA